MSNPGEADHTRADGLTTARARGRGAQLNPGNRFEDVRLHVLGEHVDEVTSESPDGVQVRTTVLPDRSRTVINRVDSPDVPMAWTVNPYRGCEHGCIYCYARPGHEYLGMSCGLEFETKIMAKHDAATILRRELRQLRWKGEPIAMSGVTDPYQPVERQLRITRRVLELFAQCRQPVSIITKSRLVLRDLDLLRELASHRAVNVSVSVTTLDHALARTMEPRAASPSARLETIAQLSAAGVPVSVMTAPIIPGINDHEIPALLRESRQAGATSAGYVLLRLPHQIKALFLDWLSREFSSAKAVHVESLLRQCRDGELYRATFGERMRGVGPIAQVIEDTFRTFRAKYALDQGRPALCSSGFCPPDPDPDPEQPTLFG